MNLEAGIDPAPAGIAGTTGDGLWYKDALIYELHVRAFFDSNDDGVGDFPGLTAKLDYIHDLGVNTIWLLPFYRSPMKDDGYDVSDYHNIAPEYGTRQDFRHFIREAERRNLRIITELVVNHTSDRHAWFQAARRAPRGSAKRGWYVWSDDPAKYAGTRIIFTDTEKSNWTWDDVAQQYYWHRFFSHQPDLNFDNPKVLKAIFKTMRFWLDMGVDGFRLDAIPYLCEREGTSNENLPETHELVRKIRGLLDEHYTGRLLLAEANQWPEDVREYFGNGDECHMAYHFPLMPRMYMAIALEDRHPISEIMAQTPEIPASCQWAIFLRNHDELTLEMVTNKERDYLYQMYAADPRARLNLGIRRRLAPLLDNDIDKIKLMNSLLLSMPGSPIVYYGDEIGMGDNVYLGDRSGVRTPMQWGPDRNAGFSNADPQRLYLQPIMDPLFGYQAVNVEAQSRASSSLLNWMRRMLSTRRAHRAFGRGTLTFLRPRNRKILAYLRAYGDETVLCVANLARSAQPAALDLSRFKGRVPIELLGGTSFAPIGNEDYPLTLPGHGFLWFRLASIAEVPATREERPPREELPVLVLFDGWSSLFRDRVVPWRIAMAEKTRAQLERDLLPPFVASRQWYPAQPDPPQRVALLDFAEWNRNTGSWLFIIARTEPADADPRSFLLPLALVWEEDEERMHRVERALLARARQQARVGALADAFADDVFCRELIHAIEESVELALAHGVVRFRRTRAFAKLAGHAYAALPISATESQSTDTTIELGERLLLKAYRSVHPGIHPELEIGRFLTEVVRFEHVAPIAGSIEYSAADGAGSTLALLQGFVPSQRDAWTHTLDYIEQHLAQHLGGSAAAGEAGKVHGTYLGLMRTLGRRTAELHAALATSTGDAAFDPEPVEARDLAAWTSRARESATRTLDRLESRHDDLDATSRADAERVLGKRDDILRRVEACTTLRSRQVKTRLHGDYRLRALLLSNHDFVITGFGGDPSLPIAERRQKHSALRDVASMLFSFAHAGSEALAHASAQCTDATASLAAPVHTWEQAARDAFLNAYREAARERGLFTAWHEAAGLIDLFLLEKAFDELGNEMDHRPDRLRSALAGIRDLVAASSSGDN